jgi:signal transduction histidine kinase
MAHSWRNYRSWIDRDRQRGTTRIELDTDAGFDDPSDFGDDYLEEADAPFARPVARDYPNQRRAAEERADFVIEAIKKGVIVLILLAIRPLFLLGVVLGVLWGIRFGRRFFRLAVEPRLRDRLLGDEVSERVEGTMQQDRRALEEEHSRSLEKLSASIAHEIRNPITAAKSLVQQLGEDPGGSDNAEYAQVALAELERVERSISHLLRFARDEDLRLVDLQMIDVLESALETFRDRAIRSDVEIATDFDCEGSLRGDPEKLRRVVINLVSNAFDALEESRPANARIDVSMGENLAGNEVWVRFRDNGVGMDAETRDNALDPFVTSKPSGTGLGLAIVKKIVDSHDGAVEIESRAGRGTEFILTFPKRSNAGGGR